MMRRSVVIPLFILFSATVAGASLSGSIENTIKNWFNGAGKYVGFDMYESSAPPAAPAGRMRCYVDRTTHALTCSTNGGAYSSGASMDGCAASSGIMTCANGFDSPASTSTGSCLTLKEGSANGTHTVKFCGASNLSTSRVNTTNADGTNKSTDIGTPNGLEFGLVTRFNPTSGLLEGAAEANPQFLPFGNATYGTDTVVLSANGMRCVTSPAVATTIGATSLSSNVSVLGGSCSVCIYNADGTTLIAPLTSGSPSTAKDCTSTGVKTFTTDPFNLYAGTNYRTCITSSSNLTRWTGVAEVASVIANAVTTSAGTATGGASGLCPTTTGTLSGASVIAPLVRVGH